MNSDTSSSVLPSLTAEYLSRHDVQVDNLFSKAWQRIGFNRLLKQARFSKRSGSPVSDVVYLLLLWVWLKADSIAMFSRESLQSFSITKRDALYDLLNREDLDWRKLHLQTAKTVISMTDHSTIRAYVVDDSVKTRRGKTMPGISSHFDHLNGRCVMGQQILTLGLATEKQFIPLDSELYISRVKAQPLTKAFADGRSIAAKRYRDAQSMTKPEMVHGMIKRADRSGIHAQYFLADSWFASKSILAFMDAQSLVSIVRMKKNKMSYRVAGSDKVLSTAAELYQHHIKGQWQKVKGRPYQSKAITVELNLAQTLDAPDHWIKVKLLFVRGVNEEKQRAGKHDWALFLSTDTHLSDERILEIYALRWGIEVYFKEAKQKLGFLKEQSTHYSAYIASIHLTALRFCLLLLTQHEEGAARLSDSRNDMINSLCTLDFASRLWVIFRALISGALDELSKLYGVSVAQEIMNQIDKTVQEFSMQVMQMDTFTLRLEAKSIGDEC